MGRRQRFQIETHVTERHMTAEEWEQAQRIVARIIARAYAADYESQHNEDVKVSGSPSTARTDRAAPALSDGDPEEWSVEQHGNNGNTKKRRNTATSTPEAYH